MSESLETLNRVAKLLPPEQQERFYTLIATLRKVPEDDEILLIIEAIGFMTLLWKEIPVQIEQILAAADGPGRNENCNAYLLAELRQTVQQSLNVPTYADMRQLAARWEQQQGVFEASISRVLKRLEQAPETTEHGGGWGLPMLCVLTGIAITIAAQIFLLPKIMETPMLRSTSATTIG
ncbi:MAG: hypothetical protein KDN22_27975 [Verrucomicrobiae bacterium]|nr:hypothetical protein [Verrucomicrobiae bacterium]